MNTKFEFVDGDTIEFSGTTLRRIRALRDIPEFNVKVGDLGGYLEKEENLSPKGACWVFCDAWVSGDARVYGDAQVYGDAWVSGDAGISPVLITGLPWSVTITDKHMRIGCQFHEIEAFEAFTDREIAAVDGKHSLRFWRENKGWLMTLARTHAKKAAKAK